MTDTEIAVNTSRTRRGGRGGGRGVKGRGRNGDSPRATPRDSSEDVAMPKPGRAGGRGRGRGRSRRRGGRGRGRGEEGAYRSPAPPCPPLIVPAQGARNDNNQNGESSRHAASANGPPDNDNGALKAARPPRFKRKARSKMAGFSPYEELADVLQRYADKDPNLIRGKMRMLWGKDANAFCTCDRGSLQRDVVIETMQHQNRSLDGDLVFVELIPIEEEDNDDDEEADDDANKVEELAEDMKGLAATDDRQPATWQDDAVQKSLWNPLIPIRKVTPQNASNDSTAALPQRKGRVVRVIPPKDTAGSQPSELNPSDDKKLPPRRTIVGTITTINKKGGKPLHLMTPNSKCMPQFLCHASFTPSNGEGGLYKAEYVYGSWAEHHNWPPCVNLQEMGRSCNVEDETLALLVENGVDHGDFPSDVLKDVQASVDSGLILDDNSPDDLGWRPTPDMYQGRRDYRAQRIFTIDPTTARDLDDALHITQLPDGRVEIGVHITDVSHFVKHDTAVDEEAKRRATTVYLVDRVIPMLPRPLCEIACSLNENVERLAFSCVWRMNMDGTVESKAAKKGDEVWYGKTVIKSCARLDYATAQNIIDKLVANGESLDEMDEALWPKSRRPTGGHTVEQVAGDVLLMHKVAMARRKLRFENGALTLNGVKLSFKLESDGETPALCAPYPIRDSNRLVEEYMLLANYLVAERLIAHAGKLAVLRHHPPPITERMESVADAARLGKGFVQIGRAHV